MDKHGSSIRFVFLSLALYVMTGCQTQVSEVSSSAQASSVQTSSSSGNQFTGEWLVTFESYMDLEQTNKVVTNTAASINGTDVYTLKFNSDFTVDVISYSNGVQYSFYTNYYCKYILHPSDHSIDLVSPLDVSVESTTYLYGKEMVYTDNGTVTNVQVITNEDAGIFTNYSVERIPVTNVRIYSNFTDNFATTNVTTNYEITDMTFSVTNDLVTETKTMITVFSYRYTFDSTNTMQWVTKETPAAIPDISDLRPKSFTSYTGTVLKGTNGYHSGNIFIDFEPDRFARVSFTRIR